MCNCHIYHRALTSIDPDEPEERIVYCPLHAAAEELRKMLCTAIAVVEFLRGDPCTWRFDKVHADVVEPARSLLKRLEA